VVDIKMLLLQWWLLYRFALS